MKKQLIAVLFALCVLLVMQLPASANDMLQKAEQRLLSIVPNPKYGNEWIVFTLARGGYENDAYYSAYIEDVAKTLQEKDGVLHMYKYTEYARVILALQAIGADPTTIGGYNVYEKLLNVNEVATQGVNGPVFALIAFDSKKSAYPISDELRQQFIASILSNQLATGSFTLDDETDNVDMTAMALQALAPYREQANVGAAVERALAYLQRALQTEALSSESYAQVIVALSALQLDVATTEGFTTVLPKFFAFYNTATGGFKHLVTDEADDVMATEQGTYAYVAYERFKNGDTSLYDMNDKETQFVFTDTVNHWVRQDAAIAQEKGIMNGYDDGTFRPSQSLTRVQAISILARVLQLPAPTQSLVFTDVANYASATKQLVQSAYEAGLIQHNGGTFSPAKQITRAQLATMMARAYTYKTSEALTLTPTTFSDIATFHIDTQRAIEFLASVGIVNKQATFNPSGATTRAHAAKMFVRFMDVIER